MEIKEFVEKMDKTVESLKASMAGLRAGRVTPALLDKVKVDLYGEESPIKYGATVTVISATDLQVKPFDPGTLKNFMGSINKADLGCSVVQNGGAIILKFPAPSEERRQELIKQAKKYAEESKVAIRNIRRDANNAIKKTPATELSEDAKKDYEDQIQKETDKHTKQIDDLLVAKTKDIETL